METKFIILGLACVFWGAFGIIIDSYRDKKYPPRFDHYGNAHFSNCMPVILFCGGIVTALILAMW